MYFRCEFEQIGDLSYSRSGNPKLLSKPGLAGFRLRLKNLLDGKSRLQERPNLPEFDS
jgi:hypothetical protein